MVSKQKSFRVIQSAVAVGILSYSLSTTADIFDIGDTAPTVEISVVPDYIKRLEVENRMKPYGDDILGDSVDLNSGSISFSHTDISIPGNSNLEVAIRRSISGGSYPFPHGDAASNAVVAKSRMPRAKYTSPFSDWMLETPRIEWQYPVKLTYNGLPTAPSLRSRDFCNGTFTTVVIPTAIQDASLLTGGGNLAILDVPPLEHHQLSEGMKLVIPGLGSQALMDSPKGVVWPNGTLYATKDYWTAKCAGNINHNAKGLIVKSPDGTEYRFDQFNYRYETASKINKIIHFNTRTLSRNKSVSRSEALPRVKSTLLATYVKDVHGNWVRYHYTPKGVLEKITSSDERTININFFDQQRKERIKSITANGRTWTYQYGNDASGHTRLKKVIQPDNRAWSFNINTNLQTTTTYGGCTQGDSSWQITHPSGISGTFNFAQTKHRKSQRFGNDDDRVGDCRYYNSVTLYSLSYYNAMSLESKRLSGPGYPPSTWRYNYDQETAHYLNKWSEVTNPDGSKHRKYYGLRGIIDGKEIKSETYASNGVLLEKRDYSYIAEPALGSTYQENQNPAKLTQPVLMNKAIITRGSDIYTQQASFESRQSRNDYSYGKPTGLIHSNNFSNDKRYVRLNYFNDKTNWRLAQRSALSLSGDAASYKEVTRTEFHSPTGTYKGLPRFNYLYGRLHSENKSYHTNIAYKGMPKLVTYNANGQWVEFNNYKRGTAQQIKTPQSSGSGSQSAYKVVDDNGWLTKSTDFESDCESYNYDVMGRLTLVNPCDNRWFDTSIGYSYLSGNDGFSSSGVAAGMLKQTISRNNYKKTVYFDAMQRVVFSKEWDTTHSNTARYLKNQYDYANRSTYLSLPSQIPAAVHGTVKNYDGLGRPTVLDNNTTAGAITYHYLSGNKIRVNDNKGNNTTTTYLAYGSPAQNAAKLIASPHGVNTSMTYNVFGNLTAIGQGSYSATNTEYRVYDGYQQLCKTVRTDVGSKAFSYNALGQITWSAEGDSVSNSRYACDNSVTGKVTYNYNALGQNTSVLFSDDSPDRTYAYDKNGRVLTARSGNVVTNMTYNSKSLIESESMGIDGKVYTLDQNYNAHGHLSGVYYPNSNNQYIPFAPNAIGQATQAGVYATNAIYHANGQVKSHRFGNGFIHSATQYNSGLPHAYSDTKGSVGAINATLAYDANNNLTSLNDNINSVYNLRLTYDGLDRLDKINDSYSGVGNVDYDAYGNITHYQIGAKSLNYNYSSSNVLSSVSGTTHYSFNYDDVGNVIHNGKRSFGYNDANQMVSSVGNVYQYDANNKRVKSKEVNSTSYSFYGSNGKLMYRETPQEEINYVYMGNKLAAKIVNGTAKYLHTDYLGSVARESSASGSLSAPIYYQPFGESIHDAKDDVGYTGHKFDKELGLSYMQARYYDPVIGRFYSNDPIRYRDVHSFNRYAYANNNPYRFGDPTGMAPVEFDKVFSGSVKFAQGGVTALGSAALVVIGGVAVLTPEPATSLLGVGAIGVGVAAFPVGVNKLEEGGALIVEGLTGKPQKPEKVPTVGSLIDSATGAKDSDLVTLGGAVDGAASKIVNDMIPASKVLTGLGALGTAVEGTEHLKKLEDQVKGN